VGLGVSPLRGAGLLRCASSRCPRPSVSPLSGSHPSRKTVGPAVQQQLREGRQNRLRHGVHRRGDRLPRQPRRERSPPQRWIRGHGVEAEATRQATRGRTRNFDPLWRLKAREDGRLRTHRASAKSGAQAQATRAEAVEAWMHVGRALAMSGNEADRDLARSIASFLKEMPATQTPKVQRPATDVTPQLKPIDIGPHR
jgi:hypothetical protein